MYFYNSLLLISNILILTVQTQTQTAKGLGKSACAYYNFVSELCGSPSVEISEIPDDCTSFVLNGVYVDLNYTIAASFSDPDLNKKYLDNLDEVSTLSKPVYLLYGYFSQSDWIKVLACDEEDNPLYEMESLQAFSKGHPKITGLVLTDLENRDDSTEFPGFSENLKKYIEVMKMTFPEFQIGMEFKGKLLINQYTNPQIPWLDFEVIEPCTDFFILNVSNLNDCTSESLYNSGVTPMTSSTTEYTMENIKSILPELSIPKEKLYFKYRLNPTSDPNDTFSYCDTTIQQMCENSSATCSFCSDTMESFYEKGQFTSENGAGFVGTYLDLNDPENKCKCEKPFGSFYAILNGFDGGDKPCCELFPRK